MTPPPSTPKRPRKAPPKIIGHTAPTPRVAGSSARSSLRSLAPTSTTGTSGRSLRSHRPSAGDRPPPGAPGMRSFPRARVAAGADRHAGAAVSVRKALDEQAAAQAKHSAPQPELLDPAKPRRNRKPGPARPTVRGRPTTPDEQPLAHAPAAGRPDEPPLRTTLARTHGEPAPHRATRRRTNDAVTRTSIERPRPSRVLAELHAALADEAAAAE